MTSLEKLSTMTRVKEDATATLESANLHLKARLVLTQYISSIFLRARAQEPRLRVREVT